MDSATKTETIIATNTGQPQESHPMISVQINMKKNIQLKNATLISSSNNNNNNKLNSESGTDSLPIVNSCPTSLLNMFNEDNHPHPAQFMQLISMMPFLLQNSNQHLPFHYSSNNLVGHNNNNNNNNFKINHHHSRLNQAIIKNDNTKTPTNFSIESILNTSQSNTKLINNDNVDDVILHSSLTSTYLHQSSSISPPPVSLPPASTISYSIDDNDPFYKYLKQNTQHNIKKELFNLNSIDLSSSVKSFNCNGGRILKRRPINRGPRIPFTPNQVQELETKFNKTQYLSSLEVTQLAKRLQLSDTRVRIWFQNRRAREKREHPNHQYHNQHHQSDNPINDCLDGVESLSSSPIGNAHVHQNFDSDNQSMSILMEPMEPESSDTE